MQRKGKKKKRYFCALIEPNEVTALNKKKNLRKKESYATENKKTIHAYALQNFLNAVLSFLEMNLNF